MITRIILFALILTTVVSCKDDEPEEDAKIAETEAYLIGTWDLISYEYGGNISSTSGTASSIVDFTGSAKDISFTIEFTEDPNNYLTNGGYLIELSSDYVIRLNEEIIDSFTTDSESDYTDYEPQMGTWSTDGENLLGFTFDDGQETDSQSYEINQLNDGSFELITTYNKTETEEGAVTEAVADGKLLFERQ